MDESVRLQRQTKSHPEIWPYQYFYYNSGRQNVTLTPEVSIYYPFSFVQLPVSMFCAFLGVLGYQMIK